MKVKKYVIRKSNLLIVIACAFLAIILFGYCDLGKWHATYKDIILVDRYINFAWGYQHIVKYVDKRGYIYECDFKDIVKYPYENDRFPSDQEYLELIIKESYLKSRPIGRINKEEFNEILEKISQVDPESEIYTEENGHDMGGTSVYAVCNDGSFLLLARDGDQKERRDDVNANSVYKMWFKIKWVK